MAELEPDDDGAEALVVATQLVGLATAVLTLYMAWRLVRGDPEVAAWRQRVTAPVRQWWERQRAGRRVVTEAIRVLVEEGGTP